MKLTKYAHSCMVLSNGNEALVIDPGSLSPDFTVPSHVTAVVITHEHADHLDKAYLSDIMKMNPDAVIIGPATLAGPLGDLRFRAATADSPVSVGGFELSFYGGKHALIHETLPIVDNLGILINRQFYYPGDSFVIPDVSVDTLALPAAAPWMRIGDAMDFLAAIHPRLAFPVHDAIASPEGKAIVDRLLAETARANGVTYERLEETIDL